MAKWCTSFFHFRFLLSLAIIALQLVEADLPPPIFIFGDSTFDVGTNDFLPKSLSRANFPFNGIDYPNSVATGRFSNGLNIADHIVRLLGYRKSPLPFFFLANRTFRFKKNILKGVNFASGGAGILNTTGFKIHVKVIPLQDQIKQFKTVRTNMTAMLGPKITAQKLSQSIFLFSIGSNDIFDYEYYNSTTESAQDLLDNLQSTYQNHLTNLYDMGARKFAIVSVPPLGCCPAGRELNKTLGGDGGCLEAANDIAKAFYVATENLLQNLSSRLPGMNYSLGNAYKTAMEFINNPTFAELFGIKDVQTACCGGGLFNGRDPCNQTASLCPNRNTSLFWDRHHPTDKVSHLAALSLCYGSLGTVTPMNFIQLALRNL